MAKLGKRKSNKPKNSGGHAYERINVNGTRYLAHRLVAERILGRKLKRSEVVHHVNGNKLDNRNCNLIICSNSYHRWFEGKMAVLYKAEHFGHI